MEVPPLREEMAAAGVMAEGFTLHLNGVPLSLPPPEGEPVVLLDRGRIVSSLRDRLASMEFAEGTNVRIDFGTKVKSVDVVHRTVTVLRGVGSTHQEEELIEYDLLIGSDGVRSRVREAMNSQLPPGQTAKAAWFACHVGSSFLPTKSGIEVHSLIN
ncbi:kmo [Symbiodinium necroappetens]|uniref:Kmo protein n=1 Tax=Symbiodinium necroappetens TaxID=1628268 RepID=A0A812SAY1_9DINO|nr:kmo [Symbiodinium necroappetens]